MNQEIVYHHSVGFVVFCEKDGKRQYLLLKYPEGHLDFVKGHIETNDVDLLDTAKRELLEETGLNDINVCDGFFETMNYVYFRENYKHIKQVDYFLGEVNFADIVLSHEHTQFYWFDYADTLENITYDNGKVILRLSETFLSSI
jgi:8-oxo-dGTP pyrophosphatase MutT (NUDIX family)